MKKLIVALGVFFTLSGSTALAQAPVLVNAHSAAKCEWAGGPTQGFLQADGRRINQSNNTADLHCPIERALDIQYASDIREVRVSIWDRNPGTTSRVRLCFKYPGGPATCGPQALTTNFTAGYQSVTATPPPGRWGTAVFAYILINVANEYGYQQYSEVDAYTVYR